MQWADNSPLAETRPVRRRARSSAATARPPRSRDPVRAGVKWFNDGVWKDHFIPNANQINSDLLAKGNPFQSGNLAMNEIHTLVHVLREPGRAGQADRRRDFGWAVAPSYNGKTTAKLHADTFSILKTTKHPDAAFTALRTAGGLGRAADRSTAPCRPIRRQQTFFDAINAALPGCQARLGRPEGDARLPGHPQPPGLGPGLRQEQGRLAGVPEQVPDDRRRRHRRRARRRCRRPSRASSTPPRRIVLLLQVSRAGPPPPGRPTPPRSIVRTLPQEPHSTHERDDRGARPPRSLAQAVNLARTPPSIREALWGFVFIGPWLIGLVLFTAGPMVASLVMSLTDFNLVHPEPTGSSASTTTSGWPTTRRSSAVARRDAQVRADRDPADDARQPRVRPAAEPPQAAGQGPAARARLHADHDPARRIDAGLDRLPQHRDGLAERDPRRARPAAARLDQQRDLDLPGAVDDRPVGDRQLHDHQHRRPPVGPDRAVRGGPDRRRRRLDIVPPDHDPADVAGPALQPRDRPDRHVPVLHPGVHDDERPRRPEQRDAVHQPRAVPRGLRVQPHGLRAPRSPGSCSSSSWC